MFCPNLLLAKAPRSKVMALSLISAAKETTALFPLPSVDLVMVIEPSLALRPSEVTLMLVSSLGLEAPSDDELLFFACCDFS